MVSHASTAHPASVSRSAYCARGLHDDLLPAKACPATVPRTAARRATSRTASCEGASKLPGTCMAIHAPGAASWPNSPAAAACSGTHCSAALETTTSVSGFGDHSSMPPTTASRPRSLARLDHLRRAVDRLDHRVRPPLSESVTVRLPGPQPRSTTASWRLGAPPATAGRRTAARDGLRRPGRRLGST